MAVKLDKSNGHLYQPIIILNKSIRVKFHKENIAYPLYSPCVFVEPAQATNYLPILIKDMINNGDLPKEAIIDGKINDNLIKTAVQEIILAELDKEDVED